jgi:hypothetical protein
MQKACKKRAEDRAILLDVTSDGVAKYGRQIRRGRPICTMRSNLVFDVMANVRRTV